MKLRFDRVATCSGKGIAIYFEVIGEFTPKPVVGVPPLPSEANEKALQAATADLRAAEIAHDKLSDRRKTVLVNSNPASVVKDIAPIEAELAIATKQLSDAAAKRATLIQSSGPTLQEILAKRDVFFAKERAKRLANQEEKERAFVAGSLQLVEDMVQGLADYIPVHIAT